MEWTLCKRMMDLKLVFKKSKVKCINCAFNKAKNFVYGLKQNKSKCILHNRFIYLFEFTYDFEFNITSF